MWLWNTNKICFIYVFYFLVIMFILCYFKLCGKRLYPAESVKYLGVKIDTNLSWQYHVSDLSIKLNRANVLLSKIRKFISLKILQSIYFSISDSYLSYCCFVWFQNYSTIQHIIILQKSLLELLISNQEISIPLPYSNKTPF